MNFLKNKKEQEIIIEKIKDIYPNDGILLENLNLFNYFEFITYFEDSNIMCEDFFLSLEKCSNYSGDEYIYIFYPDQNNIEEFFKIENAYPTILVKKEELLEGGNIKFLLNTSPSKEISMYLIASNICIMPSSFKWFVSFNRDNELGCFVSNELDIIKLFKESMSFLTKKDIFILEDELIKNYKIAENKEEFKNTPISKLKII